MFESTKMQTKLRTHLFFGSGRVGIINRRLQWDPDQWKFSPGALAQLLVLSTFIPSRKMVAFSQIHETFAGIDLQYLVGEHIEPDLLNDDLFAQLLDRMHEYGCTTLYRSISLTVRTVFKLLETSSFNHTRPLTF